MNADGHWLRSRITGPDGRAHLATCSVPPALVDVSDALSEMLRDQTTAPARAWHLYEERTEAARAGFARLIGTTPTHIAVIPSATVGAYQVVSTVDIERRGHRHEILSCSEEFPSLAQLWHSLQSRGATARVVGLSNAALESAITRNTALVSLPMVTYLSGARLPVEHLTAVASEHGAISIIDASQAVGVMPVDVTALGCDYLVAGTQKYLLGWPGVSFLYARDPDGIEKAPALTGLNGQDPRHMFDPAGLHPAAGARRFESGTHAVPSIYAATAALEVANRLDQSSIAAQVGMLVDLVLRGLTEMGYDVMDVPDSVRGGHVAFRIDRPELVADRLGERQVIVSPRGDVLRVALHCFNTPEDVNALLGALETMRSFSLEGAAT